MNTGSKLGLVLGGYLLACLVAGGVLYLYQWLTESPAAQASSGMYAFGDLILFVSTCGFLSLFPTGVAVYFLIKSRKG